MRTITTFFLFLFLLTPITYADEFSEAFGVDGLEEAVPHDVLETLRGITPDNAGGALETGFLSLLARAAKLASGSLGEGLRAALGVTAIAALCLAAGSLTEGTPTRYIQIAGVLGIAALTLTGVNSLMDAGRETLREMDQFAKVLMPALAAAGAAAGKPVSAVFRQTGTVVAANLLMTMYERLLYPLLYVYAALVTFNAAMPRDMVKRLAGFCKWVFTGLLTLTLVIFTAYLTVGGAIAGQGDTVAVKASKAALSGALPVVGGIIGDASETVLAGASVIKNAAGIFGLLAVLGIILAPCVSLAVRALAMKLGAALTGTVGNDALSGYADSLSNLYSMLMGMLFSAAFLLLVSIVSCILAGSSI
ncbi:MAG: stage III sporulation protein AE [Oscillospiraceae bacterium]|jgi:stage III sporulation protein AE|nr:stage III sporulation protein AE [Oscillospiraceae bacterium]